MSTFILLQSHARARQRCRHDAAFVELTRGLLGEPVNREIGHAVRLAQSSIGHTSQSCGGAEAAVRMAAEGPAIVDPITLCSSRDPDRLAPAMIASYVSVSAKSGCACSRAQRHWRWLTGVLGYPRAPSLTGQI